MGCPVVIAQGSEEQERVSDMARRGRQAGEREAPRKEDFGN
jgi:hypothetical protein